MGYNFTTNLLRISKKNHNSVMFDNLDLGKISFFSIGFLECGRCPKYKGRSMFLARNVIFLLSCKKIFNFGCYPCPFSFDILFVMKDQNNTPIHKRSILLEIFSFFISLLSAK